MSDVATSPAGQPRLRSVVVAGAFLVLALTLLLMSTLTFVDPDVWHEMAVAREALKDGRLPSTDIFSFTGTVTPCLHHEWGAGVLWLAVSSLGASAFLAFKYLLVAALLALCVRGALVGGATPVVLLVCALPAVVLMHFAFTTIRAQLLTLLFVAALMLCLAGDRAGQRRWVAPWLLLHLVWVNVHAAFVIGAGMLFFHVVEQASRGERGRHLLVLLVALPLLPLATPWGWDYVPYLLRILLLPRQNDITEWAPLRLGWDLVGGGYVVMLAGFLYALVHLGPRRAPGAAIVAVCLVAPFLGFRHISILAVVWFITVTPWLSRTPLGNAVERVLRERARVLAPAAWLAGAVAVASSLPARPWELVVPDQPWQRALGMPAYPVGAVDYLQRHRFRGRVMTPFVEGSYVMWKLFPQGGLVSNDTRFEGAYELAVWRRLRDFYDAPTEWQAVLADFPPDVVLVPRNAPVAPHLAGATGWYLTYVDDLYLLFARTGVQLPPEDRQGVHGVGSFP
ncbi:MAG: hypothetical protein AB2A00_27870 [Myxococcota bacterium]